MAGNARLHEHRHARGMGWDRRGLGGHSEGSAAAHGRIDFHTVPRAGPRTNAADSSRLSSVPGATTWPIAYRAGMLDTASSANEITMVRFANASEASVS